METHSHEHRHRADIAEQRSGHGGGAATTLEGPSRRRLAFSATLHCLIGCGLGEIVGVLIGTALGLAMMTTMILAILLGFVAGFLLGMIPLLRAGFGLRRAFRQVLIAEGLSIAVMETFEVLVQVYMPGVMEAGLGDTIFWYGMIAALVVGFIAAYPVNWYLIGKGVRHQH